jgi:hypothetical protein
MRGNAPFLRIFIQSLQPKSEPNFLNGLVSKKRYIFSCFKFVKRLFENYQRKSLRQKILEMMQKMERKKSDRILCL